MRNSQLEIAEEPRTEKVQAFFYDQSIMNAQSVRRWPEDKLHIVLGAPQLRAPARSMLLAELERRKAWRSPAGLSVWLSCAALVVSIASLLVVMVGS